MRIKWWQEGIHVMPDTQEEHEALVVLYRAMETLGVGHEHVVSGSGPAFEKNDAGVGVAQNP